jgi:hypothetical protein
MMRDRGPEGALVGEAEELFAFFRAAVERVPLLIEADRG